MNSRNKQQNDIMYNLNIEFGIHGVNNGDKLINTINEVLKESGDSIRVVGCNIKKPTARVDMRPLYNRIVDVNDDEIAKSVLDMFDNYLNNLNRNINTFTSLQRNTDTNNDNKEKEDDSNDKESD